jgi:hypothetical protein
MIRQAFGEESRSLTMKDQTTETERARQVESKVKSMLIIFFDIRGIVHKEFVLAGQIVNSAYYCDILRRLSENVQSLRFEFWRQKYWQTPSHMASGFLTKTNMTVAPYPLYFSPFPRLKIKLKSRHFQITEMIDAESQAVLGTITEHDFKDAF